MRNIRLDLEYDGRNYNGWQWQPNVPTIEAEIKQAIETMVCHSITPYSSGRTDAGVHAEQHVMHFFSETQLTAYEFIRGLNSLLPDDIVVYRVLDMPLKWSARHDAIERRYRYTFFNNAVSSALWRHRSHWIRYDVDTSAMQTAVSHLIGKRDFSAFRSQHCDAENPVRKITAMSIEDNKPLIHLHVSGHAFLRHQVRIIAGTLLDVGLHKISPEEVSTILQSKNRERAGVTLPAHALTLAAVCYEGDAERFQNQRTYANGPLTFVWKQSK